MLDYNEARLFPRLPIPPSSNNQYFLARRGKKTYHIPSEELRDFKRTMAMYPSTCTDFLMSKHIIQGWVNEGLQLAISSVFFFKSERLFTKKDLPKRLDCSNRIKALHDSLSSLLEVDDSWFFQVFAQKAECEKNLSEMCCTEISPIL